MFKFLQHFLSTKGPLHAIERSAEVAFRFANGPRRFDRFADLLQKTLEPHGIRMTFFVTACVLKRHAHRIRRLNEMGHEIGSHGVFHSRMDLLDRNAQLAILNESHRVLTEAGFDGRGFRPPYLNYRQDTREVIGESPFSWTSGEVIRWNDGSAIGAAESRLDSLYHFLSSDKSLSLPSFRGTVLDIPVSAPDDEILCARHGVRHADALRRIWVDVFEQVHERGELLQVLFHPERFPQVHEALAGLVEHVLGQKPAVWTPTLSELADWWKARSAWRWERVNSNSLRISAPPAASILIKESGASYPVVSDHPVFREYLAAQPSETLPAWTIGLSGRTPDELRRFLHEEGYCVEYSDGPDGHSLYLDRPVFNHNEALTVLNEIEASDKPLLRLWRWPNACRSAFCISADIDAIDLGDFFERALHF